MFHALSVIHREQGIMGLWRGSSAAVPRVTVGSASQLSTFSIAKELITDQGFLDCFSKTLQKESVYGLYKGLGASYFRLGPHTILSLMFWNQLRTLYYS